jgi:ABC-2 type transport system ATP-binding protein
VATLALDGVSKRYGDVLALDDCSLAVDTGGFHCLLGPNGSGKTTTLRLLLGLERPTEGTVTRTGLGLGSGFQRPSFYPSLTGRENLDVFARLGAGATDDWRERLVSGVGLDPAMDRRARDLSGGFARKLDLALALLHRPDVLLLDEPLGALDDVSRARVLDFLEEYADAGHGVVVSTHRISAFEPYLSRLTILHEGSVALDRQADDLPVENGERLQDAYVEMLLDATS